MSTLVTSLPYEVKDHDSYILNISINTCKKSWYYFPLSNPLRIHRQLTFTFNFFSLKAVNLHKGSFNLCFRFGFKITSLKIFRSDCPICRNQDTTKSGNPLIKIPQHPHFRKCLLSLLSLCPASTMNICPKFTKAKNWLFCMFFFHQPSFLILLVILLGFVWSSCEHLAYSCFCCRKKYQSVAPTL